jgi:hypothetical protein
VPLRRALRNPKLATQRVSVACCTASPGQPGTCRSVAKALTDRPFVNAGDEAHTNLELVRSGRCRFIKFGAGAPSSQALRDHVCQQRALEMLCPNLDPASRALLLSHGLTSTTARDAGAKSGSSVSRGWSQARPAWRCQPPRKPGSSERRRGLCHDLPRRDRTAQMSQVAGGLRGGC